ncbi:hypothetical protein VEE24_17880 [Escherichia coli]|nr:hypothetical protein VEE24_17880 [Escherichia coli]
MRNSTYKLESNISIITLITFMSYATYVFYKLGNSVYYGYPISLIWIDFNSLVLTLVQYAIIIIAVFLLLRNAYRSSNTLFHHITIISAGMMAPMLILGDILLEWKFFIINLILFVSIFLPNSCLKKIFQEKSKSFFSKWAAWTLITYFFLTFYIGNYTPNIFNHIYTGEDEIIISTNGSEALLLSCDIEGNKTIKIKSILDKKIHSKSNDILNSCAE